MITLANIPSNEQEISQMVGLLPVEKKDRDDLLDHAETIVHVVKILAPLLIRINPEEQEKAEACVAEAEMNLKILRAAINELKQREAQQEVK